MKFTNSILNIFFCVFFSSLFSITAHSQVPDSQACQHLQKSNNSTKSFLIELRKHLDSEQEKSVPYYVLGLDEVLIKFYNKIKKETQHQTLYYENLYDFSTSDHPLKNTLLKEVKLQKKYNSVEEWMPVFKKTIQNWVEATPKGKAIYFSLDQFDFNKYQKFADAPETKQDTTIKGTTNFTNAEMKFILSDKKIFNKIRWFKNNVELTDAEIKKTFSTVAPKMLR